jgi:hypothetical protein
VPHPVPGRPLTWEEVQLLLGTLCAVLGLQPAGEGVDLLFRYATFFLIRSNVASDSYMPYSPWPPPSLVGPCWPGANHSQKPTPCPTSNSLLSDFLFQRKRAHFAYVMGVRYTYELHSANPAGKTDSFFHKQRIDSSWPCWLPRVKHS